MLAPGRGDHRLFTDTRLLTFLDAQVGGPWLSIALTAMWLVAMTNAMNFIDNMDGLAGGVVAIAGSCFLAVGARERAVVRRGGAGAA
jgi:UDP-N-acetylmuramyl pentapeptide phosphotransferase/UDP-N-acetylglucosamine-1-phosphate transferase